MTNIERDRLNIKNNLTRIENVKSINITIKHENKDIQNSMYDEIPCLDDVDLLNIVSSPMGLMRRFFTQDEINFLAGEYDSIDNPETLCEGLGVDVNSEYTIEELNVKLIDKMRNVLIKENI